MHLVLCRFQLSFHNSGQHNVIILFLNHSVSGVIFEGGLLKFELKYTSQQHNSEFILLAYSEGFRVLADCVAFKFKFGVKLLEDPNFFYKEQEKEAGYKNKFHICVMGTFINQSGV